MSDTPSGHHQFMASMSTGRDVMPLPRLRPTAATPIRKLNADAYRRAHPHATPPPTTPPPTVSKDVLRARLKAVTAELEALRAARDEVATPTHLRCPITLQRMVSPVSVADGHLSLIHI